MGLIGHMAILRALLLGLTRTKHCLSGLNYGNYQRLTHGRSSLSGLDYANYHRCTPLSSFSDQLQNMMTNRVLLPVQFFSSTAAPSHMVLEMPALSPTMNQGNIAKWRKQEGDMINVGDVLCEIETDKATLEFESLEEGFLAKILVPEGSKDVLVGQPIAITVEDLDGIKNLPSDILKSMDVKAESTTKEQSKGSEIVEQREKIQNANFTRISPAAKVLIAEHGLEASSLKASGPRGTLLKSDVLAAIKSRGEVVRSSVLSQDNKPAMVDKAKSTAQSSIQSATSSPKMAYEDIPNTQIRKVIAKRLLESKQNTPHLYLSSDVILDPLLALRKELQEQHNVKVSVNDIVIKAVAVALRNVPEANAYWDNEKGEPSLCKSVDISIAVASEKVNGDRICPTSDYLLFLSVSDSMVALGLMTPIIRNADKKSLSAISSEVKELAEKARTGKLATNEFQGGTFSISNLGMFPVDHFYAIINPPQACILAVGRGNKVVEPVIGNDGTEKAAIVTKMNLTLSADSRVYDNELGGKFLSDIASNFSDVKRLML